MWETAKISIEISHFLFDDFEFIEKVYEYFWQKRFSFETNDILEYISLNPLENNNKLGATFRDIALKNHK